MVAEVVVGAAGLVERWRDLGPRLWLLAAGAAVVWLLVVGVAAVATRPAEVDAAPPTLDPDGPEPPGVVGLVTSSWRLGHAAVPATLLDLAARRMVDVDQVGDRSLVRVRARPPTTKLTPYESMVLDHVRGLAVDGVVPADALTTGPEAAARGWWRRFRRAVERDARDRGLSRPRWAPPVHAGLTLASLAVAAFVAVAATTLPDDPEDDEDSPIGTALALGAMTAVALGAAVEVLNRERDTPAGREVARRWLGLRTALAEDPLFDEQPPAAVAIWDRLLAYGAAMGVARGAVRGLPLGAERDDEAWSSVGGRWRVVRVRYPRFVPPGYGRHPGVVAALGLLHLVLAVPALPAATAAADALLDVATTGGTDPTAPAALRLGVSIALAAVVVLAALLALRGVAMVALGAADLLGRRHAAEGRVLRVRNRGDDEHPRWYVAVDDGTAARVRAWLTDPDGAAQGATVRASVTPRLAHVRDLAVTSPAAVPPAGAGTEDAPPEPVAGLFGSLGALAESMRAPAPTPTPPLPDAGAVSAALGREVALDASAPPHPMAVGGASATFSGPDGTHVVTAWVAPPLFETHRVLPGRLRRPVDGLGDEAYRAVLGGGLVVRRGGHALLVMGRVPGAGDDERDRALEAVARTAAGAAGAPGAAGTAGRPPPA